MTLDKLGAPGCAVFKCVCAPQKETIHLVAKGHILLIPKLTLTICMYSATIFN